MNGYTKNETNLGKLDESCWDLLGFGVAQLEIDILLPLILNPKPKKHKLPSPNPQLRPLIPSPTQRNHNTLKQLPNPPTVHPYTHLLMGIVVPFDKFKGEGLLTLFLFPFLGDEWAVY